MNILMVGHSRSGKTSFMAGMYKYLGEEKSGYGIKSLNRYQKIKLKKMVQELSDGKYPDSSDILKIYNFSLTVDGEDIVQFNWTDYRGGILQSDEPNEIDDTDIEKFMVALSSADALVVFLDGEKLVDATSQWFTEYDLLLSCIERSLDVTHDSWFPISFVITKCDKLPSGVTFHGLDRFKSLFKQISDSKKVGGMIIESSINRETYFSPFFVLAFSIYGGCPIYINKVNKAIQDARYRSKRHNPETIIGGIFSLLEHGASRIAGAIDSSWQWETELDLADKVDCDLRNESDKLEKLKGIADDLKEKIKEWSSNGVIKVF